MGLNKTKGCIPMDKVATHEKIKGTMRGLPIVNYRVQIKSKWIIHTHLLSRST